MIKLITTILSGGLLVGGLLLGGSTDEISQNKVIEKFNVSQIKSDYVLEDVVLKKKLIKNVELDKYKGEPKDEISVSIGDNTIVENVFGGEKQFKPNIELKRWNEVSFKLKPKGLDKVATKNKDLKFEGNKIKFDTPKISYEMYAPDDESYKYVWYLNEKPDTNKVEFEIESQGLDFFYQPPLNEENTDKDLTCTETQCKDADGNVVMERPENVVGSYAVYHSTKGGMIDSNGKDYKTGKAFHIFRPHIIDASGAETWGNLHIENGIYSVEIPQEFLDKAVYPIKSNDTFGNGNLGSSSSSLSGTGPYRGQFTAPSAGTVTKITSGHKNQYGAFYERINDAIYSGNNIISNGTATEVNKNWSTTIGWQDFTFSTNPTINAATYFLASAGASGSGENTYLAYDSTTLGTHEYDTSGYTFPNPWSADGSGTNRYSIYATYTPSGGGSTVIPQKANIILFE